jgi:predicted enzyme related to lactoylglutathione lyase
MSGQPPHSAATSQTGLFKRISLTIILVSDLKRSIQFYRDQLGLTLTAETSEWAEFAVGESRLALQAGGDPSLPNPHRAAGHVTFSFEVDDVVEAYEILNAAGVQFSRTPVEQDFGMLAVLRDPDGRDIMLFEPR